MSEPEFDLPNCIEACPDGQKIKGCFGSVALKGADMMTDYYGVICGAPIEDGATYEAVRIYRREVL